MLTLTRRVGSSVYLTTAAGEVIEVLVLAVDLDCRVKLGFRAPRSVNICREEVLDTQRRDRLRADLAAQEAADRLATNRQQDLANIDAGEG